MFWAITKRRMRLVRRRVEDLKNRFEEYRIVNQQQRLVNENGKRTIVERMQEWFQVYVPVATLEIDFGVQSLDSWGGQMNDVKWSVRNKIEIKKKESYWNPGLDIFWDRCILLTYVGIMFHLSRSCMWINNIRITRWRNDSGLNWFGN